MLETLQEGQYDLLSENRPRGILFTRFREYSSGPLTGTHLAKIGQKPELIDADWVKVEYQYEITIELVTAKETLVWVDVNIRALKRDFFGHETWVSIPTNGKKEESLLTRFGKLLFGDSFQLAVTKKGFWSRKPTYLPDQMEGIPRMPGPERP
jgi:hypothetical protein